MFIAQGFTGQRLQVLPPPLVVGAGQAPVTSRLLVTDSGYFPHAAGHGRERQAGAAELIVILCADGTGWLEAGADRWRVAAGDAAVILAGSPHRYLADPTDPWTIWWAHLVGTDADDFGTAICGEQRYAVLQVRDMLAAVDLVRDAISAMERDESPASFYEASGAAWQLLATLAAGRLRGSSHPADRVRRAIEHVSSHPASPVRVSELARAANLSVSHFCSLFRQATGTSVLEYVRRLRMARARELLLTTVEPVASIAAAVGYTDPFYFTRQFRRVNGASPTSFRQVRSPLLNSRNSEGID
jgi:AraC-like DNA-binding protein